MKFKSIIIVLFLGICLQGILMSISKVTENRRHAADIPANIVVYSKNNQGMFYNSFYQNFAQGGEEQHTNMLKPVIYQLKNLQPKLIRIDHVLDYYTQEELDEVVNSILSVGALPFFCLTNPESIPNWHESIKALVIRYVVQKNIPAYFEILNEPDLYGNWHYKKDPNYIDLYNSTVQSIESVANGSPFKVGGPATTGFYPNWITNLLDNCQKNHIRIDFISYHTYTTDITKFRNDTEALFSILEEYPGYSDIERYITESGPDSANSKTYNTDSAAIHFLSLVTNLKSRIHRLFTFEIVDGPNTNWGLLTRNGNVKPRFKAIEFMNQIQGQLLASEGNGSYVSGMAVKTENNNIQLILTNYDPDSVHTETVPINIMNLDNGKYTITTTFFNGETSSKTINITDSIYNDYIFLPPNSSAIINVSRLQ